MPNSRSSRNTMSRKSIDSAPRSPCRVAPGVIWSSSTFSASTRVEDTLVKISSWLIALVPLKDRKAEIGSRDARAQAKPAVYGNYLSSQVRDRRVGEEDRHAGDLVRLSDALHRDHLLNEVARLVANGLTHVGRDEPGRDCVDRYITTCDLDRQRFRQRIYRTFTCGVIGLAGVHELCRDARDVDHASISLSERHLFHGGATESERASQVRV